MSSMDHVMTDLKTLAPNITPEGVQHTMRLMNKTSERMQQATKHVRVLRGWEKIHPSTNRILQARAMPNLLRARQLHPYAVLHPAIFRVLEDKMLVD